ncbi:hypothetical protein PMKS-001413 [Pichia membranifaciens]|uniref:CBM1 domain-containing protein n=1 Tax=Pichia membranifaciens TaxID=4926 RepID=A0A1Q2YEL4_9ASCO|nr:hypothetical protein PMKS-001413 [Pichia membranifaciens]
MSATTRGNNTMIAFSDPYVQNNGSLDGYYEQDSSSSSVTTAADAASDSSSSTEWWTPESNTWSAPAAGTAPASVSSESITEWWTPESNTWSAPAAATAPASVSSESITEWWTPESNTWSATALASAPTASAPTASAPAASAAAPAASGASGKCQAEWEQCGGADFKGASCCQEGLTCVSANSYWARCISSTTLASGVASQPVGTAAPGTAAGTGALTAPANSAFSAADNSNLVKPTAAITSASATSLGQSISIGGYAKAVNSISQGSASSSSTNGAASTSSSGGIVAAFVLGLGLALGM